MPESSRERAEIVNSGTYHGSRPARRVGRTVLFIALLCFGTAAALAASNTAPSSPTVLGKFDFYVLALSWSPGFCAATDDSKKRSQCAAGARLGFVVHGLWPQLEQGYLGSCGNAARSPSRAALAQAAGLFPDEGLARYEWRKHGTCTDETPSQYFADVRRARSEIAVPEMFKSPQKPLKMTPRSIAQAFFDANPRLKPGMVAVICRRDILEEMRFCLTKDLRGFKVCPKVVRAACRTPQINVPPPL